MQNMTINNLIVAVDLGTSKICGVVGRKDHYGCVEIIAFESMASKGIKRGLISNLEDAAFSIKTILLLLQNKINILFNERDQETEKKNYVITGVYVGLGGRSIKTLTSKVPRNLGEMEVTQAIVNTLYEENSRIKIDDGEILEIVSQEYLVDDSKEINPVGCICTRIEGRYKLIVGHPALRGNLNKCFEKLDRKVQDFLLSPVATASAVLHKEEKESGCAMIDFGAGTTSLVIYYKNILRHVCVFPFGSNVITKDITDLKMSEEVAERLKVKCGSAMEKLTDDSHVPLSAFGGKEGKSVSIKILAGIIEARVDEMLENICYQMEKSGLMNSIDSIVITGGASQLNHLTEKLEMRTGLDIRFGLPNQKIAANMDRQYLRVEYAQLIGLLIHAQKNCVEEKEHREPVKKTQQKKKWSNLFTDTILPIFTEDSKI